MLHCKIVRSSNTAEIFASGSSAADDDGSRWSYTATKEPSGVVIRKVAGKSDSGRAMLLQHTDIQYIIFKAVEKCYYNTRTYNTSSSRRSSNATTIHGHTIHHLQIFLSCLSEFRLSHLFLESLEGLVFLASRVTSLSNCERYLTNAMDSAR